MPPVLPPGDGFLFPDREKCADSFAADVPAQPAAFMAHSQVPWGIDAPNGAVPEPAWRRKTSWYLVATDDRVIPPPAQRATSERAGSTVVGVPGSTSGYVSWPDAVAGPVERAAAGHCPRSVPLAAGTRAARSGRAAGGRHRLSCRSRPSASRRPDTSGR